MNYKLTLILLIITVSITACSNNSEQVDTSPPVDTITIESADTPPQVTPNIDSGKDMAPQSPPNANASVDTSPQTIAKNDGVLKALMTLVV